MNRQMKPVLAIAGVAAMLASAACGNSASTLSPTGPSAMGSSSLLSADNSVNPLLAASDSARGGRAGSGSAIDNRGRPGGERDGSKDIERRGSEQGRGANRGPDNSRVELTGFVTAVDPAGLTITVDTTVVSVPETARVRHGSRLLTLAEVAIGNHVNIKGTWTDTGLVATEIKVQPGGTDGEDGGAEDLDDSELEGAISEKSGLCPDLTFMIGTTKVTTSAATVFDEVGCAGLSDTMVVEVKGKREMDGSISALRVEVDD